MAACVSPLLVAIDARKSGAALCHGRERGHRRGGFRAKGFCCRPTTESGWITGARHLSPFLGGRMVSGHLLQKSVFIRELLPQDLKLEIERFSQEEAMGVAEFLAHVVGRGHARQLKTAMDRAEWLSELQRNRSKSLDAPSWLWNSVVDLVGAHEAALFSSIAGNTGWRTDRLFRSPRNVRGPASY